MGFERPRMRRMELYEVMRTAFSAREFKDEPVSDEVLSRIFENARYAPSGGNRQGGHVVVVREQATKDVIGDLTRTAARRYTAQQMAGESPGHVDRDEGERRNHRGHARAVDAERAGTPGPGGHRGMRGPAGGGFSRPVAPAGGNGERRFDYPLA